MALIFSACLSGVLAYLSVSLPHLLSDRFDLSDDALFLLPGVIFGAVVLVPRVKGSGGRIFRWLGIMLISILSWLTAVSVGFQVLPLANQASVLACAVSGGIGALILAMGSRHLIPTAAGLKSFLAAVIAGVCGGGIIGSALAQPRASVLAESLYLAGFIFWHCGVAVSIFHGGAARPKER
jgi:hypothetical protein